MILSGRGNGSLDRQVRSWAVMTVETSTGRYSVTKVQVEVWRRRMAQTPPKGSQVGSPCTTTSTSSISSTDSTDSTGSITGIRFAPLLARAHTVLLNLL
jgi:hypothetical protein